MLQCPETDTPVFRRNVMKIAAEFKALGGTLSDVRTVITRTASEILNEPAFQAPELEGFRKSLLNHYNEAISGGFESAIAFHLKSMAMLQEAAGRESAPGDLGDPQDRAEKRPPPASI